MTMVELPPQLAERFGGIGLKGQPKTLAEVRGSEVQPINVRLQDKEAFVHLPIHPRRYQVELYQSALEKNVIIYLGTGLGKTFIVVMLLNSPQIDDQIRRGRKVVFMAPTQDLVKQQAEYICGKVPYKVKVYCGRTCNAGLHIDHWTKATWDSELERNDIFFMTPAIFCAALAINVLNWDKFSLVIFDEAHHAATSKREKSGKKSGSQYSQILNHFREMYASTGGVEPRIVGLTASLINNMPDNRESIRAGLCDLERKLHAKCVTDLSVNESKPQMSIFSYNKPELSKKNDILLNLFYEYSERMSEAVEAAKAKKLLYQVEPSTDDDKKVLAYYNKLKLASSGFSIKPSSFHKVLKQLAAIRANTGLWTLGNICHNLAIAMDQHRTNTFLSEDIKPVYSEFGSILKKVLIAINDFVGPDEKNLLFAYSQPKLMCLLGILLQEYTRRRDKTSDKETFSCIVFIRSRVEVVAICSWLRMVSKLIPGYDFIKVDYAIGMAATMSSKWACITKRRSTEQSAMLEDFRRGKLNIIVTTSVLEEGIDLPVCSTVIRFDKAETFRVYVQSRGRARQMASSYIAICESEKRDELKNELDKFNDFEHYVKKALEQADYSQRPSQSSPTKINPGGDSEDPDVFKDQEKGIYITPSMARVILGMYCGRLSRKCPYSDGLQFERRQPTETTFQTTLYFPHGCPVKASVMGMERNSIYEADSSAVIAAYTVLYKSGELDKHGVPIRATEEHVDKILAKSGLNPNFSTLSQEQEGEIARVGEKDVHSYPWKICRINHASIVTWQFSTKNFKLYRIVFTAAESNKVRSDTRRFFETSIFGLIVESNQENHSWPKQIFSHYGDFSICYNLVDDKMILNDYRIHNEYLKYTFRLMCNFWNLHGLRKEDLRSNCAFYLVPLNRDDKVDWYQLKNAFYSAQSELKPDDIVKINRYYTHKHDTRKFIVKAVRHDMDAYSKIPGGRGETFLGRCDRLGFAVNNTRQPVVELVPISSQFARVTIGKRVKVGHTTGTVYYLAQFLDRLECCPQEAFQAYNFPEMIYQIYLTALALDLEGEFLRATAEERRHQIIPPQVEVSVDLDDLPNSNSQDDDSSESDRQSVSAEAPQFYDLEPEFEASDVDGDSLDSANDSDASDSDEPSPIDKQRDILSKQVFKLHEKDRSGLEKWSLDHYKVQDLKTMPVKFEDFYHPQKYLDTSPKASFRSLEEDTIGHQLKIEETLRRFQRGILGDSDYLGENEDYHRPGLKVNSNITPPVRFDTNLGSSKYVSRALSFLEALTQKRACLSNNLEALENIGDSFVKYCVSVILIKNLDSNEGQLTTARSRLVSNKHFSHLAKKHNLGCYSISKKFEPELFNAIFGPHCKTQLRPKDLADTFEALIGACLLYGGEYEAVLAMKWLGLGHLFNNETFTSFNSHSVVFSRSESALIDSENEKSIEYLKQCKKRVKRFQAIIDYQFSDASYLVQAFTHGSASMRCTESYERLEFLGDAILDYLITLTLYEAGINKDPGQLTSSRSALVNNCTFARLAINYKYDIFIMHANQNLFEELNRVNDCVKSDPSMEFLDMVDFDKITKVLADVFESVAGAIYLDSGCSLDAVYRVYYPMMKELIDKEIREPTKNVLTQLFELFPGKDRIKFEFYNVERGQDEDCITSAKCSIHGLGDFFGEGSSKRQAKKRAVVQAMNNLPTDEKKAELDEQFRKSSQNRMRAQNQRRGGFNYRGGPKKRP